MAILGQTGNIIGRRIAQEREIRSLTQAGLARIVGTTPNYISQVETGFRKPGFELGLRIAQALNIPLADLLPAVPATQPQEAASTAA